MKSLQDFYVEQGICRTELSAQLGISETVLQAEEELPVPSDAIQKIITAGVGLPEQYFTSEDEVPLCFKDGKPIYDRVQLRSYFFRLSLCWQFWVGLIIAAPYMLTSIAGIFFFLAQYNGGTESFLQDEIFIKTDLIMSSLIQAVHAVSGIFLARHITKKTGLQGSLKKYQYLYPFLPGAITTPILTAVYALMQTQAIQTHLVFLQTGITGLVSIVLFFVDGWLCARLLESAVAADTAKQQKTLRLFGSGAAAAGLLTFVITCVRYTVFGDANADTLHWVQTVSETVLLVAAAICVGFAPVKSAKSETMFFKVLPLLSMLLGIPFAIAWVIL